MSKAGKIAIVVALAVVVVAVVVMKKSVVSGPSVQDAGGLPRLVDLGSTTCIPCKMMAPVLEELKKEYAGRMRVDFINVNENPDAAKPYGIKLIPTQVFYDATGTEVDRNVGFISKEDILARFKAKGIEFSVPPVTASLPASAPAFERLEAAKADARAKDK